MSHARHILITSEQSSCGSNMPCALDLCRCITDQVVISMSDLVVVASNPFVTTDHIGFTPAAPPRDCCGARNWSSIRLKMILTPTVAIDLCLLFRPYRHNAHGAPSKCTHASALRTLCGQPNDTSPVSNLSSRPCHYIVFQE